MSSPRLSALSATSKAVADDPEWEEWEKFKEWKHWKKCRDRREGKKREQTQEEGENIDLNPRLETSEPISRPPDNHEYVPPATRSTGWSGMYKAIREYDQETLKNYQDDIDNLLVFAGLFSAVLTAFLIESYPKLLGDTSGGSSSGQGQQAGQLMTYNVSQGLDPSLSTSTSFQPSALDIRTNVLWFASLILSLSAASFGILVKQWLREYMAFKNPSPKARLRIRRMRYPALATWKVFTIAAFLPMLIHLSLALFFIGLVSFAKTVHPSIEYTTLPLVSAWGFCFVSSTISPLFCPHSPYHTALLKGLYVSIHQVVGSLSGHYAAILAQNPPDETHLWEVSTTPRQEMLPVRMRRRKKTCLGLSFLTYQSLSRLMYRISRSLERVDEAKVALSEKKDFSVLSAADATQASDELLVTEMVETARQIDLGRVNTSASLKFIYKLLRNRLPASQPEIDGYHWSALVIDLRKSLLSTQARKAIITIICDCLGRMQPAYHTVIAITESQSGSINSFRDWFLRSQLCFTLLLLLSGVPSDRVEHIRSFWHRRCGLIIHDFFLELLDGSPFRNNPTRTLGKHNKLRSGSLVDFLHGVSLLYRAVKPEWTFSEILHSNVPHSYYYSAIGTAVPDKDSLKRLGPRTMHRIGSLNLHAIASHRDAVQDVLMSLAEAAHRFPGLKLRASIIDLTRLDNLVMYICFQSYHPQWYRLEGCWSCLLQNLFSVPQESSLFYAICSVPTLGILRLCCRTANHAHTSGAKIITGIDLNALSDWDNALRHCLKDDLIRLDATYVLKLLSFSMYLYTFGTPRLQNILQAEKHAWKKIFHQFTGGITIALEKLHVQDMLCNDPKHRHHRTSWSTLATVCLEIIRFEEVLACILHSGWIFDVDNLPRAKDRRQDYFRFRYTPNREVDPAIIRDWNSTERPEFFSVFSKPLVDALEQLAGPSWSNEFDPSPTDPEKNIKFHEYCAQYEVRIGDLMKLRDKEDVRTWLHGYCSQSPKACTMMTRSRLLSSS